MKIQYRDRNFIEEIKEAVLRVIDSGNFVLGEEGRLLEKEIADICNAEYAVGVNSGTDALYLACKTLPAGGEVITTPFTFISTVEAIIMAGLTPVFVDVGEDKLIDSSLIENEITSSTVAILPVHLFGNDCDMNHIKFIADKYKLKIIEDSAQAFGKPLGGDIACLSFYPTKLFGAYGDAGMILTNSKELDRKFRIMRNHGSSENEKYLHVMRGINSRLDEIQAAILRVKLMHMFELSEEFSYDETKYYPIPLHLQPCYDYLGYKEGAFPMAEKFAKLVRDKKHE
jgi:hypothetical protein